MSFRVGLIVENEKREILLAKSTEWKNKWALPEAIIASEIVHEAEISLIAKKVLGFELSLVDQIHYGEITESPDFHIKSSFVYSDFLFKTTQSEAKLDDGYYSEQKWVLPKEALKMDIPERFKKSLSKYIENK